MKKISRITKSQFKSRLLSWLNYKGFSPSALSILQSRDIWNDEWIANDSSYRCSLVCECLPELIGQDKIREKKVDGILRYYLSKWDYK